MREFDDPRYRPLWLRLLLVAISLGWAGVELATGSPMFGALFAALGLYVGWRFFVTYDPERHARDKEDTR